MKVVLLSDVEKLGKAGEIHNVANGYFRNCLFPKKCAKPADKQAIKELQERAAAEKRRLNINRKEAVKIAEKINGQTLDIKVRTGETGKLYGAVTAMDISLAIKEKFDLDIDKHKIHLENEIKSLGNFECQIKLFSGVSAKIFVCALNSESD
jgi:large subunit ribosomal protein L9